MRHVRDEIYRFLESDEIDSYGEGLIETVC